MCQWTGEGAQEGSAWRMEPTVCAAVCVSENLAGWRCTARHPPIPYVYADLLCPPPRTHARPMNLNDQSACDVTMCTSLEVEICERLDRPGTKTCRRQLPTCPSHEARNAHKTAQRVNCMHGYIFAQIHVHARTFSEALMHPTDTQGDILPAVFGSVAMLDAF